MPGEGPRGTADVLRFSCGALDASADDQPDREHVRHRPAANRQDQGLRLTTGTLTMVFKLAESAQAKWRRLNGYELIGDIIAGIGFKDGVKQAA